MCFNGLDFTILLLLILKVSLSFVYLSAFHSHCSLSTINPCVNTNKDCYYYYEQTFRLFYQISSEGCSVYYRPSSSIPTSITGDSFLRLLPSVDTTNCFLSLHSNKSGFCLDNQTQIEDKGHCQNWLTASPCWDFPQPQLGLACLTQLCTCYLVLCGTVTSALEVCSVQVKSTRGYMSEKKHFIYFRTNAP